MKTRQLGAELFGTFWLVLGGCGSAVLAAALGIPGELIPFGTKDRKLGPWIRPSQEMSMIRTRRIAWGMLCTFVVAGCGNGGQSQSDPSPELVEYQQLLEKFPASNPGTGADVFVDGPTEQPETLAYVLKAEAIRGASSERSNNCIRRLIALSDLDGDGIAGWGIDQIWDAFGDDSTNPRNQVYLVSNAIVLDGLLSALAAKIIPASDVQSVRAVVHQSVVSALGSFTEDGDGGFFWYSTSASDAINVPNVNAYLVGVIQKAMHQHQDLFSETETASLGNRIDRAVKTLLDKSRTSSDGLPYWAYVDENYASPTDLLHHCYTILGLELYRSHGGRVALSYSVEQAADSILVFSERRNPHRVSAKHHHPCPVP